MEDVRVTAPDLARRAALEKSRSRLVIAAGGFTALFAAVLAKLALVTIVAPIPMHRPDRPVAELVAASAPHQSIEATLPGQRAEIIDRNGQPMAISLNTVSLFAYIFFIMAPIYRQTHDAGLAWKAGLFAWKRLAAPTPECMRSPRLPRSRSKIQFRLRIFAAP